MLQSNMPTFTYVKWSGLVIRYNNELYNISDHYTNKKYIYFDTANPYQLVDVNVRFKDNLTKYLIFINDKGIGTIVPQEDLTLNWNGNNDKLIKDKIFGLYESVTEFEDKFVSIETDIDGVTQTVGKVTKDYNELKEDVSKIEQKADSIDLSVRETIREFSNNKTLTELRENLNKSIIEFNSALGIFKSEITDFYKDNKVSSEESAEINTHLSLLEEKKVEVIKYVENTIDICTESGQTTHVTAINNGKEKLITSVRNLKTYITTAISDNIFVPSEITAIIDLFGKCNTAINLLKNTCDDAILLGAGGSISEELARIGIKTGEIVLSVSKVEETVKENTEFLKGEIKDQITDVDDALNSFKDVVNTTFKDSVIDAAEKEVLVSKIETLDKEKKDIDIQYNSLYLDLNLSTSVKSELKSSYDNYVSKHTSLKTELENIISDNSITESEKDKMNFLLENYSTSLANIHSVMNRAIDNISTGKSKGEIDKVREELKDQITDVDDALNSFKDVVNTTFKDSVIDAAEKEVLVSKIETLDKEKKDIDIQYNSLYLDLNLSTSVKSELKSSYDNYVSKHTSLKTELENIISDNSITESEKDKMNFLLENYSTSLANIHSVMNRAIDNISTGKSKGEIDKVREELKGNITDVDSKVNGIDSYINGVFSDNILSDSEKQLLKQNIKTLELEKTDVDNQYNEVYNNKNLVGQTKTNYKNSYNDFVNKFNVVISYLNNLVNKTSNLTQNDRVGLENNLNNFKTSLGNYSIQYQKALESIRLKEIDAAKQDLNNQIGDVSTSLESLENTLNTTFKDSIISTSEAISIKEDIKRLNTEKADIDAGYSNLYNDANLSSSMKSDLKTKYNNYISNHSGLVSYIESSMQDNKVTETEKSNINTKLNSYNASLANYKVSQNKAIDNISENRINSLKGSIDKDIEDLNSVLGDLSGYIDGSLVDGLLSDAEKITIKQNLVSMAKEKEDVDNQYTVIYNNSDLTGGSKSDLKTAYDLYCSKYNSLVSVINNIVNKEGLIDNTDQANLNKAFNDYRVASGTYMENVNLAIDAIAKAKADKAEVNSKKYVESKIEILEESIDIKVEKLEEEYVNNEKMQEIIEQERVDVNNSIKNEVNDLSSSMSNILNYVNSSFKDGVIDESEKAILEETLLQLVKEKADIDSQLSALLSSVELVGTEELSTLQSAKSAFETAYRNYTNEISRITNLPIPSPPQPVLNRSSKIHFIATDHDGDCILIQTSNGKNILIDANERVTSTQIINYLKSINVNKIDTIIITHYHSDHVGAMPAIMDYATCNGITAYHRTPDWSKMGDIEINEWLTRWYYDEFISKCNAKGVKLVTPTERQRLNLGEGEYIEFYNTNNQDYSNYNSLSFGLLYVLGDRKCFLAGDMTYNSENLVGKGTIGKVDLHKTGHHAWNYSTQEWFAKELGAKYNIITTLHINDETRRNARAVLQKNGLNVYSQATNGTIVATVKPSGVTIDKTNTDVLRDMWWQHYETKDWYWWKNNGQLAKSETLHLGDKDYHFDSNGICTNPY